jgi:hypothetical protein
MTYAQNNSNNWNSMINMMLSWALWVAARRGVCSITINTIKRHQQHHSLIRFCLLDGQLSSSLMPVPCLLGLSHIKQSAMLIANRNTSLCQGFETLLKVNFTCAWPESPLSDILSQQSNITHYLFNVSTLVCNNGTTCLLDKFTTGIWVRFQWLCQSAVTSY